MVGFGVSLLKSRRPGWEDAYLDYEGLKTIRGRIEDALMERDDELSVHLSFDRHEPSGSVTSALDECIRRYSYQFATKLHNEIEKASLFCVARLGDLADAVGALRFDEIECGYASLESAGRQDALEKSESFKSIDDEEGFSFARFGERGSLLPSSEWRSHREMSASRRESPRSTHDGSTAGLFSEEKLLTIFGKRLNDGEEKADLYADLGVELLHVLKFACLNAVAVRKIVKKYEKIFLGLNHAIEERASEMILLPNEVAGRIGSVHDDRLLQLTNNQSFRAIFSSLLDALNEFEKVVLQPVGMSKMLTGPLLFSRSSGLNFLKRCEDKRGLSLLRFECTVSSIHAIQEFSSDVNRRFQLFLSRRAWTGGVGIDSGEFCSAERRAIDVLFLFEPDFILDMTEAELFQWYKQATSQSTKHRKCNTSQVDNQFLERQNRAWGGVDGVSMYLNLISILLYTVNYYIVSPTANRYAMLLGVDESYGASLIGASSFSAIFSSFLYSVWYTRSSFKSVLAFSAACPLLGNALYSLAITYRSMKMALVGRVVCGFGCAEVVNRQLISACVSCKSMTRASAMFVFSSAIGMSVGPMIAAILDMTAGRDTDIDMAIHLPFSPANSGVIVDYVTMPGFLMSFLWAAQLLGVLLLFDEPERINVQELDTDDDSAETFSYGSISTKCGSSGYENENRPATMSRLRWFIDNATWLLKVIFENPAFPVTLYLFAFIELSGEILISSCSMIVRRYFRWNGSTAGFIVASLGALVVPADFIVERASRSVSERRILELGMTITMIGVMCICNIEGLVLDLVGGAVEHTEQNDGHVKRIRKFVKHRLNDGEFPYDWGAGVYVYTISLSVIFISTIIAEGVNTSLMCKTAPRKLNQSFVNMGLLATLVGTLGRVLGDSMIVASDFFGQSPLHDSVSATFLPLMPIVLLGLYLIRKYHRLLV